MVAAIGLDQSLVDVSALHQSGVGQLGLVRILADVLLVILPLVGGTAEVILADGQRELLDIALGELHDVGGSREGPPAVECSAAPMVSEPWRDSTALALEAPVLTVTPPETVTVVPILVILDQVGLQGVQDVQSGLLTGAGRVVVGAVVAVEQLDVQSGLGTLTAHWLPV